MEKVVSKSKFKPKALEYFRQIEETKEEIILTDRGKPVLKVIPYAPEPAEALNLLRNSVVKFIEPTEPIGIKDWEAIKK